jgi:hypothetical protein
MDFYVGENASISLMTSTQAKNQSVLDTVKNQ